MQYNNPLFSPGSILRLMFNPRSALIRLILINIAVFILVSIVSLFLWLFQLDKGMADSYSSLIMPWLAVPADTQALLNRPWTLITYMFYHEDFLHLFFNLIVLYFGGRLFKGFMDDRKLVLTYILGGLTGAFFFILSYNIFPVFSDTLPYALALGASASVLAVLVAAATYHPDYEVMLLLFGRVKLKYIAIILVVIDDLSIQRGNPGGHIAHLGGAFWGFFSIGLLKAGLDPSRLIRHKWSRKRTSGQGYRRDWKEYQTTTQPGDRPLNDEEYNKRRVIKQQRMDEILDKISRYGYEKLSQEEKEFLFRKGNDT